MTSILNIPIYYLKAIKTIISSRKLLLLCMIPYVLGFFAFFACLAASYAYKEDLSSLILSGSYQWLEPYLAWFVFFLSIFLSGIVSIIVITIIASFFIESFIEILLQRANLIEEQERSNLQIIFSVIRALKDDLIRLIYISLLILITFILGFFPLLWFIPVLMAFFIVGWDILDLPLILMEVPFKERKKLILSHKLEVIAHGAIYSICFVIPFAGILFLPLAYFGSVEIIRKWNLLDQA